MTDRSLGLLLHGGSKKGKTRLAASAPKPLLFLDAEGGSRFLQNPLPGQTALRLVYWDIDQYAPPVADGSWDVCVVYVRNYATMQKVYAWLDSGKHSFESVVIDSLSEVQQRCVDGLVGVNPMKTQDWGTLLRELSSLVRKFRDLTFHLIKPLQCVVIVAMSRQVDGRWIPYAQGQLATTLPYYMDVIAYLDVMPLDTGNGDGTTIEHRVLLMTPTHQYEAGDRTGMLPPYLVDPDILKMIDLVHPIPTTQGAVASG